ncbi:uncharacterized protein AB675_3482 [Cyphellophora attinorum]|uniref:Hemerythrin-like domain-containing protein n=1 Tax=Cyphellophora attinorum TaxID=1664694 RepID=A0A0N1H3Y3_9EURO|nr:uncharacterized protein AB675_3482 [Phialophora attinorum]KPI39755.1 hypothetical protein AB675_3482 [Phialophora attinorum]
MATGPTREPIPVIPTPPCPPGSHAAVEMAVEMVLVHNCLIRAINSIYYYAQHVTKAEDIRDFLHFCAVSVDLIHHHHEGEESFIFPPWAEATNRKDLLENVAEHREFHDGLDKLGEYARTTTPEAYNSQELFKVLDGFVPPLTSHLNSEVDRILAMENTDNAVARRILDEGKKKAMDGASRDKLVPFILGCHDATFEGGKHFFPPMPGLVKMILVWWYGSKFQATWRFCPSDLYSRPKERILGPGAA